MMYIRVFLTPLVSRKLVSARGMQCYAVVTELYRRRHDAEWLRSASIVQYLRLVAVT